MAARAVVIMDVLHATGSKLAAALGMGDCETSDAVYITGASALETAPPDPHPGPEVDGPVSHPCGPPPHRPIHLCIPHGQVLDTAYRGVITLPQLRAAASRSGPTMRAPQRTTPRACLFTVSVVLVLFGGLMSGLTLGLMSLDTVQLEILKRTGSPVEKERAARIMPVRGRARTLTRTLTLTLTLTPTLTLTLILILTPLERRSVRSSPMRHHVHACEWS